MRAAPLPFAHAPLAALLAAMLAGCAASDGGTDFRLLAPRAAEAIDPRVPVAEAPPAPASAAVSAEAGALVARARAGHDGFAAEAARLRPELEAGRGATVSSEAWLAGQAALSALVRARAPLAMALADLDRLATGRIAAGTGLGAGDRAVLAEAMARVKALDAEDETEIARWSAALGG